MGSLFSYGFWVKSQPRAQGFFTFTHGLGGKHLKEKAPCGRAWVKSA